MSIPIGTTRTIKNDVAKQQFLDHDALPEARQLGKIFPHPEPADETLNIVVRAPPIGECSLSVAPLSTAHRFHSVPHPGTPLDHRILELNCFVHDDDPRHVFPIKIARTESVGTLKGSIKDDNPETFCDVDARSLVLWKVSIPVNDGFKENVRKVELRDDYALSPVDRLSKVFSGQPEDGVLHIIVRSPPTSEF